MRNKEKMPLDQLNTDLDQDDALLPSKPALPPRITTQVQRSPPLVPPHSNQNVFRVLVKNRRQITSLTAGSYYNICFCFTFVL